MKKSIAILASLAAIPALFSGCVTTGTTPGAPSQASASAGAGSGFSMESERLGPIRIGDPERDILTELSLPASKGDDIQWGATGTYVQEWSYPDKGLTLQMESPDQDSSKTVLTAMIEAPSAYKTARGIGIGATEAEVRSAYGSVEEAESSTPGETFVAGSIYGGVIFDFKGGKVSQIFLGAGAE